MSGVPSGRAALLAAHPVVSIALVSIVGVVPVPSLPGGILVIGIPDAPSARSTGRSTPIGPVVRCPAVAGVVVLGARTIRVGAVSRSAAV